MVIDLFTNGQITVLVPILKHLFWLGATYYLLHRLVFYSIGIALLLELREDILLLK